MSSHRPQSRADEAIGGGDTAQDVDEQRDGVVGDVVGEGVADAGDGNSAEATGAEVDMVGAGGGGGDELQRRKRAESLGGEGATAEDHGGAYGRERRRGRRRRLVRVDQAKMDGEEVD